MMLQDNGNIWFGTKSAGIFIMDYENKQIIEFADNPLIKGLDVYSLLSDDIGNVWFSTNNGIYRFNPNQSTTKHFSILDGLSGPQFLPNSAYKSSNGKLFFGAPNGFNIIDPGYIIENPFAPQVYLSKITVNNREFQHNTEVKTNSKHLADVREIELRYDQNSLTFAFASNNYIKPAKNKLKYRLTNYQENWVETSQTKDITFTKIPPGQYQLEAYAANNDGVWSTKPFQVSITVTPPFWQTWYAYILYSFIFALLVFFILREMQFRFRVQKQIYAARYKNEANEMLHSEKQKFFTNISHEFFTPLTLILSPLNNLMEKLKFDKSAVNNLQVIKRNADRLLRLTKQILDIRLIEVGKIHMKFESTDIVELCYNTCQCFQLEIAEKQIDFVFESNVKFLFIRIDPDKVEKIIYNLLSNAIKHSHEKGKLILSIEKKQLETNNYDSYHCIGEQFFGEVAAVRIEDFGDGMEPKNIPLVFDRFSTDPGSNHAGSGIGLHISQEYARLNKANILVASELNKGSTFILNIPLNNELPFEQYTQPQQLEIEEPLERLSDAEIPSSFSVQSFTILLAEDNDDLRNYLKHFLSSRYKIITAKNGKQAVEIALEILPDMVITDLKMPGVDGLELINTLKKNNKTSHIPIIVLTALHESHYQLQTILKGADSFLTKPIDDQLLLAQIDNIINNRTVLEKRYAPREMIGESLNEKKSFIQMAEIIIEDNIQNPDFDISQLADNLNLSSSSLYRKLKEYSNQSASEFIRDIRLAKAAKFIKYKHYNIDEISIYVGFNSTSYFNRSFKKKYGMTPKEFRNKTV